jgi:hypothetical protein
MGWKPADWIVTVLRGASGLVAFALLCVGCFGFIDGISHFGHEDGARRWLLSTYQMYVSFLYEISLSLSLS